MLRQDVIVMFTMSTMPANCDDAAQARNSPRSCGREAHVRRGTLPDTSTFADPRIPGYVQGATCIPATFTYLAINSSARASVSRTEYIDGSERQNKNRSVGTRYYGRESLGILRVGFQDISLNSRSLSRSNSHTVFPVPIPCRKSVEFRNYDPNVLLI